MPMKDPRPSGVGSIDVSYRANATITWCCSLAHYVLDAFEGHLLAKLDGHVGLERVRMGAVLGVNPTKGISGEEVCWTPDSKYIVGGSLDGKILVWDVQNLPERAHEPIDLSRPPLLLQPVCTLDGHSGPSRCVRMNPRHALMATAGTELVRVRS